MAEKITVTQRELLKLHEGLSALDGVADKDGKIERFDFDFEQAYAISKSQGIVERAVETYQRTRKKLGAKHGVVDRMKLTEANAAAVAAFIEEDAGLLDLPVELAGIIKLKVADLKKVGIKIPGVLKNLQPIIDDR